MGTQAMTAPTIGGPGTRIFAAPGRYVAFQPETDSDADYTGGWYWLCGDRTRAATWPSGREARRFIAENLPGQGMRVVSS